VFYADPFVMTPMLELNKNQWTSLGVHHGFVDPGWIAWSRMVLFVSSSLPIASMFPSIFRNFELFFWFFFVCSL
jgi:hypothetical protein